VEVINANGYVDEALGKAGQVGPLSGRDPLSSLNAPCHIVSPHHDYGTSDCVTPHFSKYTTT